MITYLARKAFKSDPQREDDRRWLNRPETLPLDLLTQLVILERDVQDLLHMHRAPDGRSRLDMMAEQIETLNKLLRQRSGRSKKLS